MTAGRSADGNNECVVGCSVNQAKRDGIAVRVAVCGVLSSYLKRSFKQRHLIPSSYSSNAMFIIARHQTGKINKRHHRKKRRIKGLFTVRYQAIIGVSLRRERAGLTCTPS